MLEDILKAFDRWGEWKNMRAAPARVDALEKRIEELEQKLGGKWPPEVCRFCGDRAARLYFSRPSDKGLVHEEWLCASCNRQDVKLVKPSAG